jgi:TrmH family RNA methyltransferase
MKTVLSQDNPTFKQLKKLAGSSRERGRAGQALLDGVHLVDACLAASLVPEMLVVAEGAARNTEIEILMARVPDVATVVLSDVLFSAISPVETPVGIMAVMAIPDLQPPPQPGFCLMLEDIRDPGNLGSILRSAAAAGVDVVWLSTGCADAWSPRCLRGGMGAHFVLPLVERADLAAVTAGFSGTTLAACLEGDSLFALDLRGAVAFMVGNEGAGLSPSLVAAAGARFTIPMPGRMESLNAAAAAAVCLFERVRQLQA